MFFVLYLVMCSSELKINCFIVLLYKSILYRNLIKKEKAFSLFWVVSWGDLFCGRKYPKKNNFQITANFWSLPFLRKIAVFYKKTLLSALCHKAKPIFWNIHKITFFYSERVLLWEKNWTLLSEFGPLLKIVKNSF